MQIHPRTLQRPSREPAWAEEVDFAFRPSPLQWNACLEGAIGPKIDRESLKNKKMHAELGLEHLRGQKE